MYESEHTAINVCRGTNTNAKENRLSSTVKEYNFEFNINDFIDTFCKHEQINWV